MVYPQIHMRNCTKSTMAKRLFYILTMVLILATTSCESDLSLKLKDGGGRLVMFSFLTPDSVFSVHLSRSVSHSSVDDFERVYDGFIVVYQNGVRVDSFAYPFRDLWAKRPDIQIQEGDLFELRARDGRGNRVEGITTIPQAIEIEDLKYEIIQSADVDGAVRPFLLCTIIFTDPIHTKNFYQLIITETLSNGNGNTVQQVKYFKDDPVFYIRDQEGSLMGGIDFHGSFADHLRNGTTYELKVRLPEAYTKPVGAIEKRELNFMLLSHSQDYFDYLRSRVVAEYNYDLPIVDPIKIHSNVDGGLGLVGGISVASRKLVFIGNGYE